MIEFTELERLALLTALPKPAPYQQDNRPLALITATEKIRNLPYKAHK